MGVNDIHFLKLKLKLYLIEEQYEKAETMKKWIVELGGDPAVDFDEVEKARQQKKGT